MHSLRGFQLCCLSRELGRRLEKQSARPVFPGQERIPEYKGSYGISRQQAGPPPHGPAWRQALALWAAVGVTVAAVAPAQEADTT